MYFSNKRVLAAGIALIVVALLITHAPYRRQSDIWAVVTSEVRGFNRDMVEIASALDKASDENERERVIKQLRECSEMYYDYCCFIEAMALFSSEKYPEAIKVAEGAILRGNSNRMGGLWMTSQMLCGNEKEMMQLINGVMAAPGRKSSFQMAMFDVFSGDYESYTGKYSKGIEWSREGIMIPERHPLNELDRLIIAEFIKKIRKGKGSESETAGDGITSPDSSIDK